jgi:hypothetical protein
MSVMPVVIMKIREEAVGLEMGGVVVVAALVMAVEGAAGDGGVTVGAEVRGAVMVVVAVELVMVVVAVVVVMVVVVVVVVTGVAVGDGQVTVDVGAAASAAVLRSSRKFCIHVAW